MKVLKGLVLSLFLVSSAVAADAGLESLVKTERAFANDGGRKRDPRSVSGLPCRGFGDFRSNSDPGPDIVSKSTAFPGVAQLGSIHGRLLLRYGVHHRPWEWSPKAGEAPAAYGNFLSIWKQQKDGTWKVILDAGIESPKPDHPITPFSTADRKIQQAGGFDVGEGNSCTSGCRPPSVTNLCDSGPRRSLDGCADRFCRSASTSRPESAVLSAKTRSEIPAADSCQTEVDTPKVGLSSCGDLVTRMGSGFP